MKRYVAFALALLMIVSSFSSVVLADDVITLSGTVDINGGSADALVISGKTFYPASAGTASVTINVSSSDYAYNAVYLNGSPLGVLSGTETTFSFSASSLQSGSNELRIVPGAQSAYFDTSLKYGEYNLDDITINSITFSGLSVTSPASIKKHLPIVGEAGTTVTESEYSVPLTLGDGWTSTGFGGNTPNTPLYAGFIFEKTDENIFRVDTTVFSDGKYEATFYKQGDVCETRKYVIDNNAPSISFSIANGSAVSPLDAVTFSVSDASPVTTVLYVDGVECAKIDPSVLGEGSHTAYVIATDSQGLSTHKILVFNVTDQRVSVTPDGSSFTVTAQNGADVYGGTPLKNIFMYENPLGVYGSPLYSDPNEALVSFDNKASISTSAIGNKVPYHSFVVDTTEAVGETVTVSYSGESGSKTGIVLKAWNYPENRWDTVAKTDVDGSVTFESKLSTYSRDGKMKVIATPDIVYNGSDTIFWNSDTQYYSRYEALNETYYKVNEYAVELYEKGEIGYCVHTGDLIDQTYVGDETAHKEYGVADRAQAILDDAKVPNGVVSGNHDITHSTADYSYYWQYFGEDRYKNFDWYGGSLNNNMHHYDLVSIGAYDFVFLYIGTYKETEPDTIAWANSVCEAYPDRNVIICTHEYIKPNGNLSDGRAEGIWNEIVVPNENVVMVLCGHHPGVRNQVRQVGNTDRYVAEILADYQYVDLGEGKGNGVSYEIGGYPLDGEGFVRLMSFKENGQVATSTYSPVADMNGYYSANQETFVCDVDMIPANRSICTKSFNVLTNVEKKGTVTDGKVTLSDCDAFYLVTDEGDMSEIRLINGYSTDYTAPERRSYNLSPIEAVGNIGFEYINENLHPDQDNDRSLLSKNITVGLDLLNATFTHGSGSTNYEASQASDKSITVKQYLGNGGENWVTLISSFTSNNSVNLTTNNRLYFGVTAKPTTGWDIFIYFSDGTNLQFAGNSDIVKLFGDVNNASPKMSGTWNGYLDLSSLSYTGTKTVTNVCLQTVTPDETVTFDYLFFAKSTDGKVRFIIDENTVGAIEAPIGTKISVPAPPQKIGYLFDGWYTIGGSRVETVNAMGLPLDISARFTEKTYNHDYSNDANYDPTTYTMPLWVTHFNEIKEGAGMIITDAAAAGYLSGSWNLNVALAPTSVPGTFVVTAINDALLSGTADPLSVPEGGFVYLLNRGNDYSGSGTGINYKSNACNNAITNVASWTVGDKITIGGLSIANSAIPTETPRTGWYFDDYFCTATYELNATVSDGDDDGEGGDQEENPDKNGDGIPDSFGVTVNPDNGKYSFDNAYGFVFNINTENTVAGENNIVIKDAATYSNCNPNWAVSVLLSPTGSANEYKVVKVVQNPQSVPEMDFSNGNIVLVSHSSASMPNTNGYDNWMSRVAATALKQGDILTFGDSMATATVSRPANLGDVDSDGAITPTDYIIVKRHVMGTYALDEKEMAAADVDKDGTINFVDYILVKRHIMGTYEIDG